jgi:hypothetical protein
MNLAGAEFEAIAAVKRSGAEMSAGTRPESSSGIITGK